LNLRDLFENKEYEIIADNEFIFNHKDGDKNRNELPIRRLTPNKKTKNLKMTRIQKKQNKQLSQAGEIINDANACIKDWQIVGSRYRHHPLCSNNILEITHVF
jgi:hypothetical protein